MSLHLDLQQLLDEFMAEARKLIASHTEPHTVTAHPAEVPAPAPVAPVVAEPAPAPVTAPEPLPPAA